MKGHAIVYVAPRANLSKASPYMEGSTINDFVRGFLGLGVTVFVVGSTVMVWNGLVRGWAGKQLAKNPDDLNARALLLLN